MEDVGGHDGAGVSDAFSVGFEVQGAEPISVSSVQRVGLGLRPHYPSSASTTQRRR